MTIAKHSPLYVAKELFESRYKGADMIFLAGSVVRGEASTYSDLDLVVIYPKIGNAYRECFVYKEWPVEAFVHDPQTLAYFFENIDGPNGRASLPEMIIEGLEVPAPSELSHRLKDMAHNMWLRGPKTLNLSEINHRRYLISAMIDDLRDPRSSQEMIATAVAIYPAVIDFYFRTKNQWSGHGKAILRRLKRSDPGFYRRFVEAFDVLFATGRVTRVVELVEGLLLPHGGFLFEGFRQEAPGTWRLPPADSK